MKRLATTSHWRRVAVLAAFVLALLLGGLACADDGDAPSDSPTATPTATPTPATAIASTTREPRATATRTATPAPPAPTPVATASRQASTTTAANAAAPAPATGGGGDGPVARLRLPAAGIDAPVIVGAVSASNVMIAPYSAWAVAWYGFSAEPGGNGNAVFSGHVDYINVGPAVFYNLGGVGAGDAVEVQMADGRSLAYRVEYNEVYPAGSGPWETVFAPWAGSDVITIYTCAGDWDGRDYTHRRVVRAVRAE